MGIRLANVYCFGCEEVFVCAQILRGCIAQFLVDFFESGWISLIVAGFDVKPILQDGGLLVGRRGRGFSRHWGEFDRLHGHLL